jgi:hypothetical protein
VANAVTGAVILAAESARVMTHLWMPDQSEPVEKLPGPDQRQLLNAYGPRVFEKPSGEFTCATCQSFNEAAHRCTLVKMGTKPDYLACPQYTMRVRQVV